MTGKNAPIQPDKGQKATPIHLVDKESLEDFVKTLSAPQRASLAAQKFKGEGYSHAILPDGDEWIVVAGVANRNNLSSWCMAKLAEVLPAGTYRRAGGEPGPALLGWVTGQYSFDRYRAEPASEGPRVLLAGDAKAISLAMAEAEAVALVRDLVNTPAEDMGDDCLCSFDLPTGGHSGPLAQLEPRSRDASAVDGGAPRPHLSSVSGPVFRRSR